MPMFKELSASIGKLIYLRYLDLSSTCINALPNSICKLYNLQTLRVNDCFLFYELPDEMEHMISLRHIYYDSHCQILNMGKLTCLQTLQHFNVGVEKGCRIEELGHLKNLRGELTIKGLQLVRNREEAGRAYLQEKPNIYKLAYLWSDRGCEINHEYVLDGLQPHPNLKTLEVDDYLGTRFPSWLNVEFLPNLVKLTLSDCKKCKEIPSLGQLKFLRHLKLVGFDKMECIGPAFYGVDVNNNGSSSNNANIQVFPSLKELVLESMTNLIEWKGVELMPTRDGGRDRVVVRMFPALEKLSIRNCPLLKSTPNQFEVLRELSIKEVDSEMPLLNLCSNLTSLVKLTAWSVKELTCLPDKMLHNNSFSLQHLFVSSCEKFRELPQSLYNLHSLKSLEIIECTNFSSVPVPSGENHLTSLRNLRFYSCDRLTSLPSAMVEHCRSLESLRVSCCNNLVSLPLHVWEMTSLSYLDISVCPKLNSVPAAGVLRHLTGLRGLLTGPFSELVDFEAFQLMFNGIQQLSSLRLLRVYGHANWDSLPYQFMQLSSLTVMLLGNFGIQSLPQSLDNLTSLARLELESCERLQYVDFSGVMPKLRRLEIRDCPLFEALLGRVINLVSLEKLCLVNCQKIQHLPFGDDMRCLTKLRYLRIGGCPQLEESFTNRSGPNSQWSKISHISLIHIGD